MLALLNISNIALIDSLQVEFDLGLNLLTGETGSGKSIIVDALGVLLGGRFSSDLLKSGAERAFIEGLFSVKRDREVESIISAAGIEVGSSERARTVTGSLNLKAKDGVQDFHEIIVRRELSLGGRTRVFINNQLATQNLLRDVRPFLVDIHGQGDQQTLFNADTHLDLLDAFAGLGSLREQVADSHQTWSILKHKSEQLRRNEEEKFQLSDDLKFQIDELRQAKLAPGEDALLEEERQRLQNVEKLTTLSTQSFRLIYDDNDAALTRLLRASKQITELAKYESKFLTYLEGLESARASLEDVAFSLRDYSEKLEFSPERLALIEDRLAEISRLKRKYGGSIQTVLEHLAKAEDRLGQFEHAHENEKELDAQLASASTAYLELATKLHRERLLAAEKFEQVVERNLAEVAMETAKFQVQVSSQKESALAQSAVVDSSSFTARGIDKVEFYFSANVGEAVKPLARVASGGEASRLMLVLKTVANASEFPRTIVFDEIDAGIGGRVSEAVGAKLKKLSETNQVFCVTHQPQIARFANCHLLVQKAVVGDRTQVTVEKLDRRGRVEELARMLTGAEITDSARRHAREMLKS